MSLSSLKRFFRLDRFEDHLELARVRAIAADEDLADYTYASQKRSEWTNAEIWPEPLITGNDLIDVGFAPGPLFREILDRVEDEQLERRLTSRDQALGFVKQHYKTP